MWLKSYLLHYAMKHNVERERNA